LNKNSKMLYFSVICHNGHIPSVGYKDELPVLGQLTGYPFAVPLVFPPFFGRLSSSLAFC